MRSRTRPASGPNISAIGLPGSGRATNRATSAALIATITLPRRQPPAARRRSGPGDEIGSKPRLDAVGDLRRGAPLRSLCERAANAAALPCYADDEKGLVRLVDEELRSAGMSITADARATLVSLIGGDRGASRSEIRKLALFAHGKDRIDLDDVIAVVADATAPAVDAVIDAAFAGRLDELETNFARAQSSGVTAGAIAGAAVRQASALHRLRLAADAGSSTREAVERAVPPIHFSRKDRIAAALDRWSAKGLERIIVQLGGTVLDTRQRTKLAYPIVQRALLSIAFPARHKE